jgi:hypothetical protein
MSRSSNVLLPIPLLAFCRGERFEIRLLTMSSSKPFLKVSMIEIKESGPWKSACLNAFSIKSTEIKGTNEGVFNKELFSSSISNLTRISNKGLSFTLLISMRLRAKSISALGETSSSSLSYKT